MALRGDSEHEHSEATGPGDTHPSVSDRATSLMGSVHGLHRKHVVRNIGTQSGQSACAVHKAADSSRWIHRLARPASQP